MKDIITHVAIGAHNKELMAAIAFPYSRQMSQATVDNAAKDMAKMLREAKKQARSSMHCRYEAGACRFNVKRQIDKLGCRSSVVAPSLVPVKSDKRIKTDRGAPKKPFGQFLSGQMTEVCSPDLQEQTARQLARCRHRAYENLKRICHQLVKFLIQHGYISNQGHHWTKKHLDYLRPLQVDLADIEDPFELHYTELHHCMQRLSSLDKQIEQLAGREQYRHAVNLLRCFRTIDTLTAIAMITEIFEFARLESPLAVMSYLRLVLLGHFSGDCRSFGSAAKTGDKRVRRLLVESSWHYRQHPSVSRELAHRRDGQVQWAIDIADRAMAHLHGRYRQLAACGRLSNKVVVAFAQELAGFIWPVLHGYEDRKIRQVA